MEVDERNRGGSFGSHSFQPMRSLSIGSRMPSQGGKRPAYIQYLELYKFIDSGDIESTRELLDRNQEALLASLSPEEDRALHIAVSAGHVEIVEELVIRMDPADLAIKTKDGATALIYAAIGGILKITECLVTKNPDLPSIPNGYGQIPVVVASLYGHKSLVRYLYSVTPSEDLDPSSPSRGRNGAMLVTSCIVDGVYDIALDLIRRFPELAYVEDTDKDTALDALAQKPSAFPSGNNNGEMEMLRRGLIIRRNGKTQVVARGQELLWKGMKFLVPRITRIYELKLAHAQAKELLSYICQKISILDEAEFERIGVDGALFKAVRYGIVEFVEEMIKHYPDIVWCQDAQNRTIFMYATLQKQEKIFSLIYRMGAKKNFLATSWDKRHNNMLHHAASLAPPSQLERVPGAALQMQRELQWYKEVESIVQPKYVEMVNASHKTPGALFSEKHKNLVEAGEKWMKETAESCTVVAALIATMMFSSVFTIPGGFDETTGRPLYLDRKSFIVFIIADAMSLFSSCTSLLTFLGILKSRYREEDFLKSLPTKLIVGLFALFFSIATMMVTFAVTLEILLQERIGWVTFPIVLFASIPVSLFALQQFPLLLEILWFTYGPGIFDKPRRRWWWSRDQ